MNLSIKIFQVHPVFSFSNSNSNFQCDVGYSCVMLGVVGPVGVGSWNRIGKSPPNQIRQLEFASDV